MGTPYDHAPHVPLATSAGATRRVDDRSGRQREEPAFGVQRPRRRSCILSPMCEPRGVLRGLMAGVQTNRARNYIRRHGLAGGPWPSRATTTTTAQ